MRIFKAVMLLLCCGVLAITSSCKKKVTPVPPGNTSPVTIQIKAKYGSQSFALNSPNVDASGRYVTMTALQFYLSHISLITTGDSLVTLSPVAIVDFTDSATLSFTGNIAPGSFTGISFGCGLDSAQNKSNPNDTAIAYPNPLNGQWGMYWDMISEYRFEVLEGKWSDSAVSSMPNYLIYHIGTNANYRKTKLNKAFTVCCSTPYALTVYLDVQQIFSNTTTSESINIATEPETQSGAGDNPAIAPAFADNFSNAFTF